MLKVKSYFYFFYFIALALLLWSVVLSGYKFQFNADEVFNANTIYLMTEGFKPYVDFYTVYSPILHWVLTPVFLIFGFNFEAISMARIVMVGLFLFKLLLMYLLVRRVFGNRAGFIFIPLYLLSPFVVFSEMQIRPDNLMMLFYMLFLLVFSQVLDLKINSNFKNQNSKLQFKIQNPQFLMFLSRALCGLTLLTNIKILPSLSAFGLVFLYYIIKDKFISYLLQFINGFCLAFLVFFAYFFIKGYAGDMFLHVFLDPVRLNNSIPNATWLGYFYFSNPTIYGLEGKPMNWAYTWFLPVLTFAGGYASIISSNGNRFGNSYRFSLDERRNSDTSSETKKLMTIILFISLVLQWASMLFINSVFIQYYIPINWLYAVFTAYFIDDLLFKIEMSKFMRNGLIVIFLIIFVLLYQTSIQANISRSNNTFDPIVKEATDFWKLIPEDRPTFPNLIFRKPIYPILWGSTFAPYMRNRYPPAFLALEKNKIPILTGLTDEYFNFLDSQSREYILKNYQRDVSDSRIWIRKK